MVQYKYIIISILLTASLSLFAQLHNTGYAYPDKVYKSTIRTVQFYREGNNMSPPVIEKDKYQNLILSFDELAERATDYSYTVRLCRQNWEPSSLPLNYYIQGFENNPVKDYNLSFNTTYNYVHYKIAIPNDDIDLTLCGNYMLIVYEDGHPDSPVMTKRFIITDPGVNIQAAVERPDEPSKSYTHQKVRLHISSFSGQFTRPEEQLTISISKNKLFKEAVMPDAPTDIRGNKFIYDHDSINLFPGGNEFRHFNSKSLREPLENIADIVYTRPYYFVFLVPDASRALKNYMFKNDINGQYSIDNELNSNDVALASDYVSVHFSLPYNVPLMEGNFYVYGKLNNWQCDSSNMLQYNYEQKAYECTMLLKQGYYDYVYAYKQKEEASPDLGYLEGNHFDTENKYFIIVYETDPMEEHDKPIGFKVIRAHEKDE